VLTLWSELEPDLDELDSYGGGSDADEDHVFGLLDQIREQLKSKKVAGEYRQEILAQVLPFFKSGNVKRPALQEEFAAVVPWWLGVNDMDSDRKKRLVELGPEALADALLESAVRIDAVDDLIEHLIATPMENIKRFKSKLAGLKRRRRFIAWHESAAYARDLEMLLKI
jgi:hypothetical protein